MQASRAWRDSKQALRLFLPIYKKTLSAWGQAQTDSVLKSLFFAEKFLISLVDPLPEKLIIVLIAYHFV